MTVWVKKSLGEVAKLRSGIGFPRNLQGRSEQKYPFAKVGDISAVARAGNTAISSARNAVSEEDLETLRAAPFPAGTIAFAKIGEAISQNFRVVTTCPMLLDNNVMGVIPDPRQVDTRYLLRYLQSLDFYALTGKTAVPAIRKSVLERVKIPLPPLPEQRRIAAILDKADAIRRKRQQTIDLADQFLRSAFLDMFGDPVTNPKGWPLVSIGKLAGNSKGAIVIGPFGSDLKVSDYRPEGHPVIFVRDIQDGTFVWDSQVFVDDAKFEQLRAHRVVPGDVLATKMGAPPAIAAVYPSDMPVGIITADIIRIRPDVSIARPTYLAAAINSPYIRAQVRRITEGVTRPKITLRSFRQLSIPVPPLELQGKWEQLIRAIERLLCKGSSAADRTHTLFNTLAQRAFRGELLHD